MTIRLTEEEAQKIRLLVLDAADAAAAVGAETKGRSLYELYIKIAEQGNKRKQPKPGRGPGPSEPAHAS